MKTNLAGLALSIALTCTLAGCAVAPPAPAPTTTPAPAVTTALTRAFTTAGWALTVDAVTLDATSAVRAANEFNPAPAATEQYATVTVTLARTATAAKALDVAVTLTVDGTRHSPAGAVAPGQLHLLEDVAPGHPVTGTLAFTIPKGTKAAGVNVRVGDEAEHLIVVS